MKRKTKSVLLILFVFTILTGYKVIQYMSFPFNEEGRFFDENELVVYKEQTKELYVILFFLLLIILFIFIKFKIRLNENVLKEKDNNLYLLVGNIKKKNVFGQSKEIVRGTKHFSGGTKVYIVDWYPGTCETIVVLGLHKKSKKLIEICLKVDKVENLRVKAIYKPKIINILKTESSRYNKELAMDMLKSVLSWQKAIETE